MVLLEVQVEQLQSEEWVVPVVLQEPAVQHMLADLLVQTELLRELVVES
jgi:alkylation response protein AidB-like acyl-CoA dehydrogenase